MSGRTASPSKRTIFPTLRFRAKIILGFAAVLVISAGSMAFSYFGFERVSDGVGSYRRALSAAEVKITGAPVWVHALDEPGVYLPSDDVIGGPREE